MKKPTESSSDTVSDLTTTAALEHDTDDVESQSSRTRDLEKEDILEMEWDSDPENPLNWKPRRKWLAVAVVGMYSIASPLSSTTMAPALQDVAIKYQETDSTIIALTLCSFILSFGLGSLFWAPVSEMHGRTMSLHVSNIGTAVFNLVCGFSPNINVLIGMRVLTGFFASAPMAIGAGSISDLYAPKDRASAMSIYALGPLLGPVIGPVIGGYTGEAYGVRYIFIVTAAICAASSVIGIPLLTETYAPVLLKRRATKNGTLTAFYATHPELAAAQDHPGRWIWSNLQRPTVLLFRSFVLFMLTLYMAFLFGLNYLMFATFSLVFTTKYGFKTGAVGLANIGIGVGCIIAAVFSSRLGDGLYQRLGKKDGENKPEHRLPFLILGSIFPPIGLLWYGWSADAGIHWIMPIIGTAIFGFGMLTAWLPIQLYVVDAFTHAASASSALAVFRCLLGFAFPLFAADMFKTLGIGGGNSLLAGLAVLIGVPFPIWLWFNGEEIRKRSKYTK